jgi:hypothetical protein
MAGCCAAQQAQSCLVWEQARRSESLVEAYVAKVALRILRAGTRESAIQATAVRNVSVGRGCAVVEWGDTDWHQYGHIACTYHGKLEERPQAKG